MLEKKEFEIPSEKFKKGATVYTDSDTPVKAAIIYFHGGSFIWKKKRSSTPSLEHSDSGRICNHCFDYPLAPAAKVRNDK